MTDHINHHFVPQFYFRHFSSDGRMIGTLLIRDGRTFLSAPIKGQCARKNFYGSKELELIFSQLESCQCNAIRAALDVANNASSQDFSSEELFHFFQAILFQRGRTALEIDKTTPATENLCLELFKHYLQDRNDVEKLDEMIDHIDAGNVKIRKIQSLMFLIPLALLLKAHWQSPISNFV